MPDSENRLIIFCEFFMADNTLNFE